MLSHHLSGECMVPFNLHIDMKYLLRAMCAYCLFTCCLCSVNDFIHVLNDLNCICILYLQNVLGKTWVDIIVVV